ncbi:MAG TPA: ArsR family transcriptional regulator [Candidatus Limnocylindrales bacterium]|nr:ArsR family transcriptional regulator [Candidatus Limnocylindrales bacterium]
MKVEFSLEMRARIHAALGDPGRLAIADALAVGDASPGEIAGRLGMTTNLVAHHLKVLEEAGMITRSRSDADKRRTYVRLRPQALAALKTPALTSPRRVVFVCTRNSARSQFAAALWSAHREVPAASAGTDPAPRVHPRAVRTAKRHGLRLDPTRTSHVDSVTREGDLVIAVCDHVHESLPAAMVRLHWSVPDPVPAGTDTAFESAYADIAARIDRLGTALIPKETS